MKALRDRTKERRERSAFDLVDLGEAGVRALVRAIRQVDAKKGFRDEPDRQARRAAVAALWKVKEPASVDVLIEVLDQGNEWNEVELMMDVVGALGHAGDVRAVPTLVAILDRDSSMKAHVCGALGRIGGNEAIAALRRVLENRAESRPRVAALEALEKLGVNVTTEKDAGEQGFADVRRMAAIKGVFDGWHSGSSFGRCDSCGIELLTKIVKAVPATLIVDFFEKGFHFSRSGTAFTFDRRSLVTLNQEDLALSEASMRINLCRDCAWDVATFAVDVGSA